jgi:signal peptidase I
MVDGVPVINGWTVPMCKVGTFHEIIPDGSGRMVSGFLSVEFLGEHAYLTLRAAPVVPFDGPYLVEPGEVFVLGDNRNNSIDSRAYRYGRGGGVPLPAIEARIDRFLAGTDRSGETDLSPLWRPLAALERDLRSPTPDQAELHRGISDCLGRAPDITTPPVASEERTGDPHPLGPT